jgi:hypothetical protein
MDYKGGAGKRKSAGFGCSLQKEARYEPTAKIAKSVEF